LVRIIDDLGQARAEHRAGNTGALGYADLRHAFALGDPRKQLAGVGVMQKERSAFGV